MWVGRGLVGAWAQTSLGGRGRASGLLIGRPCRSRGKIRSGEVSDVRSGEDLRDDADLRTARSPHEPLLERSWRLRHDCTADDAAHATLAEEFDRPLITGGRPLAAVPGHRVTIELFAR